MEFEVEPACVADWISVRVPSPQRRGRRAAVGATRSRSPRCRLQKRGNHCFNIQLGLNENYVVCKLEMY